MPTLENNPVSPEPAGPKPHPPVIPPIPGPDYEAPDNIFGVPFVEPGGTSLWANDQIEAPYHRIGLSITYEWDQGTLQIPIAAPFGPSIQPAAVLVQLCAPYMQVLVDWHAERVGEPPVAPDPRPPSGSNYVLKKFRVAGRAPELTDDGTNYLFQIAGAYEYFLAIPNSPDFGYQLGSLPTQVNGIYVYSAAQFRSTIFQLF